MLNRYPLWKYLLILVVLVVGLIYSLPNLFPAGPAIQVSDAQGNALDERQITRVEEALSERDIAVKAVEENNGQWLIRLQSDDDQLDARDIAAEVLGPNATVALQADGTLEVTVHDRRRASQSRPMRRIDNLQPFAGRQLVGA